MFDTRNLPLEWDGTDSEMNTGTISNDKPHPTPTTKRPIVRENFSGAVLRMISPSVYSKDAKNRTAFLPIHSLNGPAKPAPTVMPAIIIVTIS